MKTFFKKILIPISIAIIFSAGFLVFSQTALGQWIDFKDLPAAIKEAIISVLGLKTNPGANPIDEIQLLLINEKTSRPGINNIGDILGVFDGDHQFSPAEEAGFDIVRIKGISKEQAESALQGLLPNTEGMTEEQRKEQYTQPKYQFRVLDKTKTDITQMVESNMTKK